MTAILTSNGTPLQYSCLENPMDGGAWWAAVHGVAKSRTRLSDFTFTFHFPALEKAMATHSSVLAWRTPGMGEPGGLLYMGSHRVGHDWSDLAAAFWQVWSDISFWFWFAFPWWLAILGVFSCACWTFACPLWKNIYSGLLLTLWLLFVFVCVFFFLMLSCMNCLYILDINPLSVLIFASIFSHSISCFLFCWWFLCCSKAFKFN